MKRRSLLGGLAAAATPILAGCIGGGDGGGGGETATESPTSSPTESPTATRTESATASPTATPGTASAQEAYPDYEWSKLEGADSVPTDTITMSGFEFHPLVAAVEPGTEVTVTNEDSSDHSFTVPKLDVDETVSAGASTSITVEETGTYDYVCTFHPPGMLGRLVVTTDPPSPTPSPTGSPTETPTPTETSSGDGGGGDGGGDDGYY